MTDPEHETALAKLKAAAWSALSGFTLPQIRPLRVRARNKLGTVTVTVVPPGAAPRARRVGQWLSPAETLILTKLGSDTLTRIELARRCGMAYDPTFKALARNLIDRGILVDDDDGHGVKAAAPHPERRP